MGYKNATIKTMVTHLRTWFVITNAEKIAIKAAFHAPWSDTPNDHITTFARQLNRRQTECLDHGVTITEAEKVVHFIEQMYTCGLFEARFLDDWEESLDKSWATTLPLFVTQFNKERRTLERANNNKNFASANVFRERHAINSRAPTFAPTAPTTTTADYNAAMEYAAAMEAKSTVQEGRILELENALDDQTALTLPHELAASATNATTATASASAAATELAVMKAMIQSLAATVTSLTTKSATDGGRGRDKKGRGNPPNGTIETPGTHKCVNYNLWVKHKDANCYDLAANAAKRFPGWVTRLKK